MRAKLRKIAKSRYWQKPKAGYGGLPPGSVNKPVTPDTNDKTDK